MGRKSEIDITSSSQLWIDIMVKKKGQDPTYLQCAAYNVFKRLITMRTIPSDSKILDLGCGLGHWAISYAHREFKSYGIDIDPNCIKFALNKNSGAFFIIGCTEHLPFKDNSFDLCIANSILEHTADYKKTISEVARILKEGGLLYLSSTNKLYPFRGGDNYFPFYSWLPEIIQNRITDFVIERWPSLIDYSPYPARHWFTHVGLRKELTKVGFTILYDNIDIFSITGEIPIQRRYRFCKVFLPILKIFPIYLREVALTALPGVTLYAQKGATKNSLT